MAAFVVRSLNQALFSWSSFFIVAAAVIIGAIAVFFWALHYQKKRKRKRKHRGHGRIKPTLAQVGGLPPLKKPGDPSPGEDSPFDP